jgi:hypothetical protein
VCGCSVRVIQYRGRKQWIIAAVETGYSDVEVCVWVEISCRATKKRMCKRNLHNCLELLSFWYFSLLVCILAAKEQTYDITE